MISTKGCALYFDAQSRSPKVMDAHLTLMPTISWPPVAVAVVAGMVVADRKSWLKGCLPGCSPAWAITTQGCLIHTFVVIVIVIVISLLVVMIIIISMIASFIYLDNHPDIVNFTAIVRSPSLPRFRASVFWVIILTIVSTKTSNYVSLYCTTHLLILFYYRVLSLEI